MFVASATPFRTLERLRARPLSGGGLVVVAGIVWVAGAIYCSGYERLLSGVDNWPGSLIWSAVAVLPWLALFEWSKSAAGRRIGRPPLSLALLLIATALVSLSLEAATDLAGGSHSTALGLSLLRRVPAIGSSLLLILWSRAGPHASEDTDDSLGSLASSIDWVGAADNYVELHIGERVLMRRMTMRATERALVGRGFVRIHRRFLVNRRRIARVVGNGDKRVQLGTGTELPVGRAFAANLTGDP